MFTIMIIDDNEQLQNEIGNLLIANRRKYRFNIIRYKFTPR